METIINEELRAAILAAAAADAVIFAEECKELGEPCEMEDTCDWDVTAFYFAVGSMPIEIRALIDEDDDVGSACFTMYSRELRRIVNG